MTMTIHKQPPLLEDLRNHSQEQISELRLLLSMSAPLRPDARRPGFFEVDGDANVYYIFKYPTGTKVLLVGCVGTRSRSRNGGLRVYGSVDLTPYNPIVRFFQSALRRTRGAFCF